VLLHGDGEPFWLSTDHGAPEGLSLYIDETGFGAAFDVGIGMDNTNC